VRVRASVDDSRVRVLVDDSGRFVPVASRPDRGLGLRLAEQLASAVDITMTEAGTTVALEKRLPESDEFLREAR
jgi:anti-sigma regulatory factor (Ser/Thr protein kinase)